MSERRFIEETFPVKEVSEESAKEKSIQHGHISALHIWWARRPLASSRAINYAALIPVPKNEEMWKRKKEFIAKLSKWENSIDQSIIDIARKDIFESNDKISPRVLDPFAGGGAIPLEAAKLGCETFAADYNPVSVLILKCVLEYPQKYSAIRKTEFELVSETKQNKLVQDIKKWGGWILKEVEDEISCFYPKEKKGFSPVGYTWAKTIPCQNPSCHAEIPLIRQYWLAKMGDKKVAVYPFKVGNEIQFKVVGTGYEKMPIDFDPLKGTVSRAIVTCLICGYVVDGKTTSKLFREGEAGERLIAIINHAGVGKKYRIATMEDYILFKKSEKYLEDKRKLLFAEWGIDPIPDEPTPDGKGKGAERAFSLRNYNMNTWGDLFNSRQKLAMVSFIEKVRKSYKLMINEGYDVEYAKAVVAYLAVAVDRLADKNSNLVVYQVGFDKISHVFGRQTLGMAWDYVELNPFADVGWKNMISNIINTVEKCSRILSTKQTSVNLSSATELNYPNDYFDAILTDPPYYDNIPYSYLSDFFYVWLKRSIGDLFPELFSTPLTPKSKEIVVYSNRDGGFEAGKKFFEDMMKKTFSEINRVLKPNGICVIVYAHKSTSGWETLINSLLSSGLVVTAGWPIHTEKKGRMRATESAALASSIYMVARKRKKEPIGFYLQVKTELRKYLNAKLDMLWKEGISGADFFISAIGSAIEVFGKYEKVVDDADNPISIIRLLNDTREIVTNYAIQKVIHSEFADQISKMTRFYILWRWAFGETEVPFDNALKMAQSIGIDIEHEWNKGFIMKDKENIRIIGPDERKVEDLEGSHELIDILHHTLVLWKKNKKEELDKLLQDKGYSKSDMFKRVAQAISELLPIESTEKKWLDGFLTGFKIDDSSGAQTKLF